MNWSQVQPIEAFAPSADPTQPGILTEVENIIPVERGWRSAYSLAETGMESLTAACVGAALCQLMDGSNVLIAGTPAALWLRSSASWTDIKGTDTYAATADLRWRFKFTDSATSPVLKAAFQISQLSFTIDRTNAPADLNIPDVKYTSYAPQVGIVFPLGSKTFQLGGMFGFLITSESGSPANTTPTRSRRCTSTRTAT